LSCSDGSVEGRDGGFRGVLTVLRGRLAVCRFDPGDRIPDGLVEHPFWSATRTDQELSVVLPESSVSAGWRAEGGWRCLKVEGPLDFGLTGVLASLSVPLAKAGISLFALSTYDTDYLLVRDLDLERARAVLAARGHTVHDEKPAEESS
jgi:hypothetical protein